MARGKKYQPEQVVNLMRQIEVAVAKRDVDRSGLPRCGHCGTDLLPLAERIRRSPGRSGMSIEGVGVGEREAEAVGQ